jgi:hypothetical protein
MLPSSFPFHVFCPACLLVPPVCVVNFNPVKHFGGASATKGYGDGDTFKFIVSGVCGGMRRRCCVVCGGGFIVVERAVVTTIAGRGSGSGSDAGFKNPRGVAVDANGNVFVADTNNHRICKVTAGGGMRIGPLILCTRFS